MSTVPLFELRKPLDPKQFNLKEYVIHINRVSKVVKGGKNLSFSVLVVVGDPEAHVVGYGLGKAREVPMAIRKGIDAAKKNLKKINVLENTIPHAIVGRFAKSMVLVKPAPPGTGVIAGGTVRAVMEAVGIRDVVTKSLGSRNPHNVVKAAMNALEQLHSREEVCNLRSIDPDKLG